MIEKIKSEIITLPPSVLAGVHVRYSMAGQADGSNPPLWLLWQEEKTAAIIKNLYNTSGKIREHSAVGVYYDLNKDGDGRFSYGVGLLMKEDSAVPDELILRRFPECQVACVYFRYAKDDDIWSIDPHSITAGFMEENGYAGIDDADGWCAEEYHDELCGPGEECLCYMIAARKKG